MEACTGRRTIPSMTLRDAAWWTTALFFFGMGIAALVRPPFITTRFGITLEGADAHAEVRAVYGGFGVAIAALMACVAALSTRPVVAMVIATATLGMAGGRVLSALVTRGARVHPTGTFVVLEVLLTGLVVYGG